MAKDTDQDLHLLIVQLSRKLTSEFEEQLAALDLTAPQAHLLRQLDKPLPMVGAAERMHCDPSNVTGIVDRLERRGLVARKPSAEDRRVKELELTEEGRRLALQVETILAGNSALKALSDADRQALTKLLEQSLGQT